MQGEDGPRGPPGKQGARGPPVCYIYSSLLVQYDNVAILIARVSLVPMVELEAQVIEDQWYVAYRIT